MTARPAGGHRGGLARYVVAATLARAADGGAVLAVVLLAHEAGLPGWVGGLLGASVTAPHLLGPFVARVLDGPRDARAVTALACVVHGAGLAAALLLLPRVPVPVTAALLLGAGLVGPLLTGGLSGALPRIAAPDRPSQRRAQGWDVATYTIAGTLGPAVVAVGAGRGQTTGAALALAAATAAAALVVRRLPPAPPAAERGPAPAPVATLRLMARTGPLRRTTYLTTVVSLAVAALPVAAVALAGALGAPASTAGALVTAYGLGGLLGSAAVTLRPLTTRADPTMTALAATLAVALGAVVLAPGPGAAALVFGVTGFLNSCFFAATLAARSEHAPPASRGQVFVWVGALKITAGSAGTAVAGALVGAGASAALLVASGAVVAVVLASVLDRRAGAS